MKRFIKLSIIPLAIVACAVVVSGCSFGKKTFCNYKASEVVSVAVLVVNTGVTITVNSETDANIVKELVNGFRAVKVTKRTTALLNTIPVPSERNYRIAFIPKDTAEETIYVYLGVKTGGSSVIEPLRIFRQQPGNAAFDGYITQDFMDYILSIIA